MPSHLINIFKEFLYANRVDPDQISLVSVWRGGDGNLQKIEYSAVNLVIYLFNRSSLNSVSFQCARGKSSIARKPKTIPKFLSGKCFFKNVTLQILYFIPIS